MSPVLFTICCSRPLPLCVLGDFGSTTVDASSVNRDGVVVGDDLDLVLERFGNSDQYGVLSHDLSTTPHGANRTGYDGYEQSFVGPATMHRRHRVSLAGVGRWAGRGLLGSVDGMTLCAGAGSGGVGGVAFSWRGGRRIG